MHCALGAVQVQDNAPALGLLKGSCYPGTAELGQLLQVIRLTQYLRLKATQGVSAGRQLRATPGLSGRAGGNPGPPAGRCALGCRQARLSRWLILRLAISLRFAQKARAHSRSRGQCDQPVGREAEALLGGVSGYHQHCPVVYIPPSGQQVPYFVGKA